MTSGIAGSLAPGPMRTPREAFAEEFAVVVRALDGHFHAPTLKAQSTARGRFRAFGPGTCRQYAQCENGERICQLTAP